YVPVQAFEPVAVEEAPDAPLPAGNLARAPEEDAAVSLVDRRCIADDAEGAAGTVFLLIRNREAEPEAVGLAELDPIEIHAALADFLEDEAGLGLAQRHLGALVALGHRMRGAVEIGAVHRVHDVVDRVAVIAGPMR